MSSHRALIPFALSLLLLACGGPSPAPETTAPSITTMAAVADTPIVEPPTTGHAAGEPETTAPEIAAASKPETPTPAQPLTRQPPPPIPGLSLGSDYEIIENGQRFTQGEQVEVAEIFAYWCGGCAHFQPLVEAWVPRLPAGTRFVYVPLVGDPRDQFPKAFYAAEAMGITSKVHAAIFRAIHIEGTLRPNSVSIDQIAAFLAQQGGATVQEVKSTMDSFAVNANLGRARQFAIRNGVKQTPDLVIDGKYRVIGKDRNEQLQIADRIIAHLLSNAN